MVAVGSLAWTCYDGDPWYAQNAGIDTDDVSAKQDVAVAALSDLTARAKEAEAALAFIRQWAEHPDQAEGILQIRDSLRYRSTP